MRFAFGPAPHLFASAIFASAALGLTGCAKRERPVDEGIRTRTLLVGNQNEPASLDPHLVDSYTDSIILTALFEGLTGLDEKTSQALPGVAERWESSADGLTWTFYLRADAKWSNGDAVTAHDFAFSFQRLLTPAFGGGYSYMLWHIKNAEAFNKGTVKVFSAVGVEAVDDRTLRLRLERPTPYLPALATHQTWFPVHRATLEKFGKIDDRGNPWTRPGSMVSNGPFTLAEWKPNSRIVVTKNPRYWGAAQNRLERVIFFPIENSDTEERNFRAGQLHLTFALPSSKIASYRETAPDRLRIEPLLSTLYLNFNTTKPPFDNPKVRRALALTLDRAAIAKSVYAGSRLPARTFTAPGAGLYAPPQGQPEDVAAARALLTEAGFPEGRGLPAFPLQVLNDDKQPKIAEALQAMWQRALGVRITIEPYEQKTWLQNQRSLFHTLALLGWTADFADPITFLDILRTGSGDNRTGWSNRAYDTLLDQAAQTADPAARYELLQKAETLLLTEAPIAPINFGARAYLIHPAVRNWEPAPIGQHRFQHIELRE